MADTTLSTQNGGTGANSAGGARSNLGAAASGANSDITALSGLTTPISIGQGGTGSATQPFVDLTTAQTVGGAKSFSAVAAFGAGLAITGQGFRAVPTVTTATTLAITTASTMLQDLNAASNAIAVTLPSTTVTGLLYFLKKVDSSANAVTISSTSIDGAGSVVLSRLNDYVIVASTATSGTWRILGSNVATKVSLPGATSGSTSVIATAAAGSTTLTLPAATDTLVGKATTDALTNKTITDSTNSIGGAALNGQYRQNTQAVSTNTTQTALVFKDGWNYCAAASGNAASTAITFPTAFGTSIVGIELGVLGFKNTSAPTVITDFNTSIQGEYITLSATSISTTGFTASMYKSTAYSASTNYYGFWWRAIGT